MPLPTPNPACDPDGAIDRDRRYCQLFVWPATSTAPWRAALCVDAEQALRHFKHPRDLLGFLTQPGAAWPAPGGLR